jgi:ABC-type antimicrobial peptide transport system permease subunit
LPLLSVRTLDAIESEQRTSMTRAVAGIGGAGALALFLSAIGLYATVALAVRHRVREIGIRTALGADRQQVVRWFLMRGLRLCLVGLGLGLTLSVVAVRLIAALQGEEPSSSIAGLAALVAGIAIAVALFATWIPARRAAAIDPILALRVE